MKTPKETPPAATEGVDNDSAGEQIEHSASGAAVHEPFWSNAWNESELPAARAALSRPPGLVGDIADFIYGFAQRPMLEASVLAALGLVAGVAGRCYNVNGDGLNLYMLLLAPTGRGKSAMAKGIDRLVTEIKITGTPMVDDFIGPAEFASGPALHNAVSENPSMLCVFGEFGLKLKAMSGTRTNENEEAQLRLLLDLYNKSGRFDELRERRYADKAKSTPRVRSPAVTIVGESTPETIYENLSHELVRNGLLPRFILMECDSERPPRNRTAGGNPPEALVSRLRDLVAIGAQSRVGPDMQPVYRDIALDSVAACYLDEIDADLDETYNSGNPIERELWNRALQNVNRVAGLLAIGLNPHNPVITEACAQWAVEFVFASTEGLLAKFNEGLVGGGDSRQEAEVKRFLRDYLGMSASDKQFGSYKVPKSIAEYRDIVGLDYLRRRARQCASFTKDRRGYRLSLDAALVGLVQTGALFEIKPHITEQKFGLRSIAYRIYNESLLR